MTHIESRFSMAISYFLILGVAVLRVELINPYNVVPVFACLLFFAAVRPSSELVLPLSLLVGIDIFITTHRYGYQVTADAVVTWAWYLIVLLLGAGALKKSRPWQRVAGCSLLASISFFVASNFAVWAGWQTYPKTLAGLGLCYLAALPFFRNSVTAELCTSLMLFGLMSRLLSLAPVEIARSAHS
jgi:hypothetical protein